MNFEIISYGSADFLRLVFNGIASIFGNGDYRAAMQVSALIGFVGLLAKSAFDKDIMANFRWFMGIMVFIMVVLVPKTNVIINDRINPAHTTVISNVPIGLAMTAGFFSFTGDWLTRMFETVFSMPASVNYSTNGLLFSNKLLEASSKYQIHDSRINDNFSEFIATCVVVDGIGNKRFTWQDVISSDNLASFFYNNVAANAAHFRYVNSSGNESILPCRSGFALSLNPELEAAFPAIMKAGMPGDFISRFGGMANATSKLTQHMSGSMTYITGVTKTPKDIVVQSSIINAIAHGVHKLGQETGATEWSQYISSGSEVHRLTTYHALGNIANEKLPLLRIIFEAIIYAVFPIVVLMAILSPMKVSMGYIKILVWINLWGPMYAILHFVMTFYTHKTMPEFTTMWGGGLSLLANNAMTKFNADIVATTGYITTMIPMLAWMMVSSSGAMAAGLAGRVMQGYDNSVEQGANEITKGSGERLGNKFEMTGGGIPNSQGSIGVNNSHVGADGTKYNSFSDGTSTIQQAKSDLHVSAQVSESAIQAQQQAYNQSVDNVQTQSARMSETSQAVLNSSQNVMEELRNTQGTKVDFNEAAKAQHQKTLTDTQAKFNEWADKNGINKNDQVTKEAMAQVQLGFSFMGSGGGLSGSDRSSESSASTEALELAKRFQGSEQYAETVASVGEASRQMGAQFGLDSSKGNGEQLASSLATQTAAQQDHSAATSQSESLQEQLANSKELRNILSMDQGKAVMQAGEIMGYTPEKMNDLINRAAGLPGEEQQKAMNELRLMTGTAAGGRMPQMDPDFGDKSAALYAQGQAQVEQAFAGGQGQVAQVAGANDATVTAQQHVSTDRVESAVSASVANVQKSLEDPGTVSAGSEMDIKLEGAQRELEGHGSVMQSDVEDRIKFVQESDNPAGYQMRKLDYQDERQDRLDREQERQERWDQVKAEWNAKRGRNDE